jgi:hypothetical protein
VAGCIDRCVARWVQSIRLSRRHVGVPNHMVVRYEHLVEAPEVVIKGLCEFIGVSFSSCRAGCPSPCRSSLPWCWACSRGGCSPSSA